ncbi:hypothetical protein HMPREF1319_2245 [Capnocytophaga ochracea str. Holt 25]|nr:hypothetical protein HMPREF1320_1871 [Capnocytophaga sp. oral taxon 335 str. F0486]EJF43845.1 hypothetical protein HMPREF1319_2245 [Capnocytophaga ochracea str. Holt 25]
MVYRANIAVIPNKILLSQSILKSIGTATVATITTNSI